MIWKIIIEFYSFKMKPKIAVLIVYEKIDINTF